MKIVPVILSGVSGTMFWLLPRKQLPKQYLSITVFLRKQLVIEKNNYWKIL